MSSTKEWGMARSSSQEYELLPRSSIESNPSCPDREYEQYRRPYSSLRRVGYFWIRESLKSVVSIFTKLRLYPRHQHKRRIFLILGTLPSIAVILLALTAIFQPSYTSPPEHYKTLEKKCKESQDPGRGNINNEKVFIAASLYDSQGILLGGQWGNAIRELVQLLGPFNVHLSIYENDPDKLSKGALKRLGDHLLCKLSPTCVVVSCFSYITFIGNVTLVSEHFSFGEIPRVTIPSGEKRTKRIAFLAAVRNRALRPLQNSSIQFDKLLYINDVIFNPIEAIQLLFSTNVDAQGLAQYGAACAVDFINPFKFYDRYATRDLEGYETGIPFFPWFTDSGKAESRKDVLAQKDAVRVRACWGGMTAFEARWFQSNTMELSKSDKLKTSVADVQISPLRFRYEVDPFWDASECCLIHADLTYLRQGSNDTTDTGIYTNPYIRVAYDAKTLSWLPYTRLVERIYPFIHNILNHSVGFPRQNPRRLTRPGEKVSEKVWKYANHRENLQNSETAWANGSYHDVERLASPGGFCGRRKLVVSTTDSDDGNREWISVPLPLPAG